MKPLGEIIASSLASIQREYLAPVQLVSEKPFLAFASPLTMLASDGNKYVIKTPHNDQVRRSLFSEQVHAHIGRLIGAPIPNTPLIMVNDAFLAGLTPEQKGANAAGIAHGSHKTRDCPNRCWVASPDNPYFRDLPNRPEYRENYAAIAIFFRLFCFDDPQIIEAEDLPSEIFTVDHGHFLPCGIGWSSDQLRWFAQATKEDPTTLPLCFPENNYNKVRSDIGLTDKELEAPLKKVGKISTEDIVMAVSLPPDEWGIDIDERVAAAEYISARISWLLETSK